MVTSCEKNAFSQNVLTRLLFLSTPFPVGFSDKPAISAGFAI